MAIFALLLSLKIMISPRRQVNALIYICEKTKKRKHVLESDMHKEEKMSSHQLDETIVNKTESS